MRIINIVDSVDSINYGVWHAAIVNATLLAENGIQTELWYPDRVFEKPVDVTAVGLPSLTVSGLQNVFIQRKLDPVNDIIVTHGAWKYPTRWGAWLKGKGFNWVYVPQGMLEPWSMEQKWLKKKLYYNLFEKRLIRQADSIRAVSFPESRNLQTMMKTSTIDFIPNGVKIENEQPVGSERHLPLRYLFLSRLHHKKNVVALVSAWLGSALNNDMAYELLIAGPDQGELNKLMSLIQQSQNIQYVGSVYGDKKKELLKQCTFYVLPSFSEGLPSSLLEAMNYGLVPVITEGCNLPDVFTQNLGVKINTGINSIMQALEQTSTWDINKTSEIGLKARNFIKERFSLEAVTNKQIALFTKLLANAG